MAVGLDVDERNRIIGDNLRKYRLLKGMTQDELADGLCSVSQLSKVENGKTYVKRTMLKQMADRLGVTVERIESADALMEELTETLQLSKDAHSAKNYDLSIQLIVDVLEKSREFRYENLVIEAMLTLASFHNNLNQYEDVIGIATELLDSPKIVSNQRILTLCYLGNAYDRSGNVQAAYDCYIRADEEYQSSSQEDQMTKYNIHYSLSKCNSVMGSYRNAIRYAEKAEEIARDESWHNRRIRSACLRAIPLRRLGKLDQAEQIYNECLIEAQDNSYLLDVAIISNNLGEIYQIRGEYGQAIVFYNRAKAIHELQEENLYICEPLLHLAEIAYFERDHTTTLEYLRLVFETIDKVGVAAHQEKARAFCLLGKVSLQKDDVEKYLEHTLNASKTYAAHHVYQAAYDVAIELAEFFYENGDSRAVDLYRQAVEYNNKIILLRR